MREVHFHPGVRSRLGDAVSFMRVVILAHSETCYDSGWNAFRPQHNRHGRGVVGAEAARGLEQEVIHRIAAGGRGWDVQLVGVSYAQVVLNALGHVVRGDCVANDAFGQIAYPLRQGFG